MDPLSDAQKGQASPFLINVGTVNKSLSILRKAEKTLFAKTQDKTLRNDPVGPTCRILIRNDTGSTLLALSCVEIGDPTISAVNAPFELMRHPMFAADTPTASDVAFAITEEPIPAGQYGRAVVLGVVPCDVNITDTGHGYAAPVSGSTVLTSAATGPARILWSEGGTGTQKAVVLIDRQGAGSGSVMSGEVLFSTSYTISTAATWEDTGWDITLPTAGTYLVAYEFGAAMELSAYISSKITTRFYNETAAAVIDDSHAVCVRIADGTIYQRYGFVTVSKLVTVTGSSVIRLEARADGGFFTVKDLVASSGLGGDTDIARARYIQMS